MLKELKLRLQKHVNMLTSMVISRGKNKNKSDWTSWREESKQQKKIFIFLQNNEGENELTSKQVYI